MQESLESSFEFDTFTSCVITLQCSRYKYKTLVGYTFVSLFSWCMANELALVDSKQTIVNQLLKLTHVSWLYCLCLFWNCPCSTKLGHIIWSRWEVETCLLHVKRCVFRASLFSKPFGTCSSFVTSLTTSPSSPLLSNTSKRRILLCHEIAWMSRTLCNIAQERITSRRKVTLRFDIPSNLRNVCFGIPKAFSTTPYALRILRLNKDGTTDWFWNALCGTISHGKDGVPTIAKQFRTKAWYKIPQIKDISRGCLMIQRRSIRASLVEPDIQK